MTFNSLDGMEEAVLREASVLPLLQNWPGGHLGNNDAADFYNTNCFSFNISSNTYFSDFCPPHLVWPIGLFFQLCLYHNIRLLSMMSLQILHNLCGFAIFSWEYPTMGFSQQLRTFFLADNIIPNLAIIQQVSIFCHMAHPPFCMRNSYRILAQPLHRYLTKPTQPCPINYFFLLHCCMWRKLEKREVVSWNSAELMKVAIKTTSLFLSSSPWKYFLLRGGKF